MKRPNLTTNTQPVAQDAARRTFIKQLVAAGLVIGSGALSSLAFAATQPRLGIQLYTVRDLLQQDVRATLQLLAELGYQELEFAGLYDKTPTAVATWLKELGLTAPAGHVLLKPMLEDTHRVIDEALTLGHRYLVMPYLFEHERNNGLQSYQQLAEQLNRIGEQCQKSGISLAYHNHDFEFAAEEGTKPYDVLLTQTDAKLVKMEIDLYWAAKMNIDVTALFRRYPGRFPLWHMKDMNAEGGFADLGQGIIDFSPVVQAAELAGLQHAFVERDVSDNIPQTLNYGVRGFNQIFS